MCEPDSRLVAAEVCRPVGDNHTGDEIRSEYEDLERQRREYMVEIARAGWACAGDVSEGTLHEWDQLPDFYQAEQVAFAEGVVRKLVDDGHVQGTWQAMPGAAEWWAESEGRAIVNLPDPTQDRFVDGGEGCEMSGWEVQAGPHYVSVWHPGEVQIDYGGEAEEPATPEYVREFAAALLAAARVAEGGT